MAKSQKLRENGDSSQVFQLQDGLIPPLSCPREGMHDPEKLQCRASLQDLRQQQRERKTKFPTRVTKLQSEQTSTSCFGDDDKPMMGYFI